MHRLIITTALFFLVCFTSAFAQQPSVTMLDSGHKTSLRGLSVINDNIIWASGSNGTIARSTDGGKTFAWLTVSGYEKRDFRDIEAFDASTAVIMAVATPAIILKTTDGGQNWKEVFNDTTSGMFLDAMNFAGSTGIVIGDPINNYVFVAYTKDGGNHWQKAGAKGSNLQVQQDEAFFASSGTNVQLVTAGANTALMVSGGSHARLIKNGIFYEMPLLQGSTSQGANSIAVLGNKAVVTGGDFAHDTVSQGDCVLFDAAAPNPVFTAPQMPPHGYRSCVAFITANMLITCGTSGIDISNDAGLNWQLISRQSFHVCQKAKTGTAVFLAGAGGKIAKLVQ